jgi:hypothetical protein
MPMRAVYLRRRHAGCGQIPGLKQVEDRVGWRLEAEARHRRGHRGGGRDAGPCSLGSAWICLDLLGSAWVDLETWISRQCPCRVRCRVVAVQLLRYSYITIGTVAAAVAVARIGWVEARISPSATLWLIDTIGSKSVCPASRAGRKWKQ